MASTADAVDVPKKTRKTRIVRRRRRVRDDDIESDGEPVIERSDSESDVSNPTDSEDDDDEDEDAAVDAADKQKSADAATPPADNASATTLEHTSGPSSKDTSHLWSDEVAAARNIADGGDSSDLPVIDFAELSVADNVEDLLAAKNGTALLETAPSSNKSPQPKEKHVPAHVVARQSYLKKLDNPAFTPRVGQFWGHDDRLMDKGERPMSEWWRGRWASRGGRGGYRGRGGTRIAPWAPAALDPTVERDANPIGDKWGHDGFEALQKLPERERRGAGRANSRGRGGSKEGGHRGGRRPSPASQLTPTEKQVQLQADAAAKIASKQKTPTPSPDGHAHPSSETTPPTSGTAATTKPKRKEKKPKARLGDALSQAVKERETAQTRSIVAQVKGEAAPSKLSDTASIRETKLATVEKASSPAPPKVNLPSGKTQARAPPPHQQSKAQKTVPPAGTTAASLPEKDLVTSVLSPTTAGSSSNPSAPDQQPQPTQRHQRHTSDKDRSEAMERAILKNSFTKVTAPAASVETGSGSASNPAPPVSTPPYPSYSYVSLPPGIAMGESGMLYEIATNRPVVLNQPTPPLQPPASTVPLYHPRPYLPPHLMSSGSGFATPTPEGSANTQSFFAPPKAPARVSIRQPGPKEDGAPQAVQGAPAQPAAMNASAPAYRPAEAQYYNGGVPYYAPQNGAGYEDPYYGAQYYQHPGYGYPAPVEYGAAYPEGNPYANYDQNQQPPPQHTQQYIPPQGAYY